MNNTTTKRDLSILAIFMAATLALTLSLILNSPEISSIDFEKIQNMSDMHKKLAQLENMNFY